MGIAIRIGLTGQRAGGGFNPAALYEGQIATRTFVASNLTAGQTQAMCRSFHYARDDISALKLVFQDAYGVSEVASGATTTVEASIEYPEGVFTRVLFSGGNQGSMASGGTLVSDETAIAIPNGAKFWVRRYQSNANGFIYNLYSGINAAGGDRTEAGASVANAVMGGNITSNVAFCVTPQAIIGQTRRPSVFLLGDSRVIGVGDDFADNASGDTGQYARSIGPEYAYINAGIAGDRASGFLSAPTKRLQLAGYCSHVAVNFAINDVTNGAAEATIRNNLLTMYGILQNDKDGVFAATLPPVSTSTDAWATTANQTTAASNSVRVGINAFIRTQPDNLQAVWELSDSVEDVRDNGKWKVGDTEDGVHESEAGYIQYVTEGLIDTAAIVRPPELTDPDEADLLFQQWATQPVPAANTAYRTFIAALKTAGVWAKLDALWVMAAPDVQAARVNLIAPKRFRLTRYNGPTFAAYDGFTGDASSADLSTNYVPSRDAVNYALNSASMFVYSMDNVRANTVLVGFAGSGAKAYINPYNSSSLTAGHALNNANLANGFNPVQANGLFTVSRTGSANYDVYRGATNIGTQATASTAVPVSPLRICSGGAFFDGTRTVGIFGIGGGLTSGEVASLNTACNALIAALGAI